MDWGEADVSYNFTIDTEEMVAYIENIPAGNYIFGLFKEAPGENYDPEFSVGYYSKEDETYYPMTIKSTLDVWENSDFEINDYWYDKFNGEICITKNEYRNNWSFPKDVARFEIRIVDDGQGNESFEVNIEYKDYQDQIDTIDEVVSAALVDLNEKKVESEDIHNIVKIEQSDYDALIAQSATTSTTLYVVIPDQL